MQHLIQERKPLGELTAFLFLIIDEKKTRCYYIKSRKNSVHLKEGGVKVFRECICLWKRVIYTWNLAGSSAYFNLAQEAYCKNDISRAIVNLEKALKAGKKAFNLLSGKYFPEATEARKELREALELIEALKLITKSQEKPQRRYEVDINHA
jgi:hypothetical protein